MRPRSRMGWKLQFESLNNFCFICPFTKTKFTLIVLKLTKIIQIWFSCYDKYYNSFRVNIQPWSKMPKRVFDNLIGVISYKLNVNHHILYHDMKKGLPIPSCSISVCPHTPHCQLPDQHQSRSTLSPTNTDFSKAWQGYRFDWFPYQNCKQKPGNDW